MLSNELSSLAKLQTAEHSGVKNKMRLRSQLQLYLKPASPETKVSEELSAMSKILDESPLVGAVYAQVLSDLYGGVESKEVGGRDGMSAEQVLRAGILRYRFRYSYRQLAHASEDSLSVREFLKIGYGKGFKKSALQQNIKRIQEGTWKQLNECLKNYAIEHGIESGTKIRTDTTTTETNIHYPTDSSLLCDSVRVLTRAMTRAKELTGASVEFVNHYRASKTKLYIINNSRKQSETHQCYLELIRLSRHTVCYAEQSLEVLKAYNNVDSFEELLQVQKAIGELTHYIPLVKQVIDQAYRRIVRGEKVPSREKIVSIFEPHTDILVKGSRDIVFGHKVVLTTGASQFILDACVLEGNPADSSLVSDVLNQYKASFGRAPEQAAFDGCFASEKNRVLAKSAGVKELTFSKNRFLDLDSLVSSQRIHKLLRNFRAGIEATISLLKRIFSWSRVFDKGRGSFAAAIQAGAVACNLFLLARVQLT